MKRRRRAVHTAGFYSVAVAMLCGLVTADCGDVASPMQIDEKDASRAAAGDSGTEDSNLADVGSEPDSGLDAASAADVDAASDADAGLRPWRVLGRVRAQTGERPPFIGEWYFTIFPRFDEVSAFGTAKQFGDCLVATSVDAGGDASKRTVSAGVITLSRVDGGATTFDPSALGDRGEGYVGLAGPGHLWFDGDTFSLEGEGGVTIDPFRSTGVAPDPVEVDIPALASDCPPEFSSCAAFVIERAHDLEFRWSPKAHGALRVSLSVPESAGRATDVTCWFPLAAGSGVIPVEALQTLAPDAEGTVEINASNDQASQIIEVPQGAVLFELIGDTRWTTDGARRSTGQRVRTSSK